MQIPRAEKRICAWCGVLSQLLCVQTSSLSLLLLAHTVHALPQISLPKEVCFQPSLCFAGKVPLPLPFLGAPEDMDLPQSSPRSRALPQQGVVQDGSGRILPHPWPSSSRVSFFHFPASLGKSSAGTVPRREHA